MFIQNNIWSIAEAYVSGSMSDTDKTALLEELHTNRDLAVEFNECVNLLRSLQGSSEQKRFRSLVAEIGEEQRSQNKTKIIPLRTNYWRVAAIAASVALLISFGTLWSVNRPDKKSASEYSNLRYKVENLERTNNRIISDLNTIKDKDKNNTPVAPVRYTGTGFAITNDGYLVTNYHVIEGNDSIYIQNHEGKYFKASLKAFDLANDIAILKVENKNFRFGKTEVPYTFAEDKSGLATRIYTLGFPKEELVYNEGYISGKNGFRADSMQYRLELPTEDGQSGSPVLDEKGNVLAIVTAHGNQDEGNTYAVSSIALLQLIDNDLPKLDVPKINKLRKLSREQQVEKLEYYTCTVKVYKK
jgi:S1-C subfamily serine protease